MSDGPPPHVTAVDHAWGRIWRVDLDAPPPSTIQHQPLPVDVETRAARYATDTLRRRHLSAHRHLQALLRLAAHADPTSSREWAQGPHGKPTRPTGPAFNLSRRDRWAAMIVGVDRTELGIDIEHRRAMPDALELAQRVFTHEEQLALNACEADERSLAFLRGWTRKEAVLKAIGSGLTIEPACFEAGLAPLRLRCTVPGSSNSAWVVEVDSLPDEVAAIVAVARVISGP